MSLDINDFTLGYLPNIGGWKFTLHPLFCRLWVYTVIVLALEKIILQMNFPVHYQTLNASLEGRDFAIFKVLFTILKIYFYWHFFWWVVKPTQPEKLDTFKRHKQLLYCFGNKSNLTDNLVELIKFAAMIFSSSFIKRSTLLWYCIL